MCELVEVSSSSFFAFMNRTPSARDVADEALLVTIRELHKRSRHTYGVPRVYGQLRRTGQSVARSRVSRLMRANGQVGAHATKKWRRGRPDIRGLADLLSRDFTATAPNQRWVADVTKFATGEGKFYLAGVRDLFHRGIVCWDTSAKQDSILVVNALPMTLTRTGHRSAIIHHGDKGSIYTPMDFAFNPADALEALAK